MRNPHVRVMTGRSQVSISRIVVPIVAGVLMSMPQTADAQKNIKIGVALPKDKPGGDFINGMYERFGSEVQARTNGTLTVEIVYGGALGDPNGRMNQMQNGAIQMSDAADGNYATVYPEIGVLGIPYLFATEQNAHKVLDGPFGQKLAEDLRAKKGSGCLDGGTQVVSNTSARTDHCSLRLISLGLKCGCLVLLRCL